MPDWRRGIRQRLAPPPAPPALPPPGTSAGAWPGGLRQDVWYTFRTLRASPAFTLTVLLALALSIGPVTAIVSIGNWLLWRPHPGVSGARSLAVVWFGNWRNNGVSPSGVSYENLEDLRAAAKTIAGIAGVQESSSSVATPGQPPTQSPTAAVTANFFDVLGVRMRAGRGFTPDEDRAPFGAPVAVISHALARSAFGSAERAVGRTVTLNSRPFTVRGVADPAFGGISTTGGIDVWHTGAAWPYLHHVTTPRPATRTDGMFYEFVVRAAPGATFVEVEAELKVLARRLADSHPDENNKFSTVAPRIFPGLGLPPLMRASTKTMVNVLLLVGGVLLLLGCANVANLLVFRVARREQEVAIRKALGASPARLLQLQVMESWLLSASGAALGLVLAFYLKQVLEQLLFPKPPGMSFAVPIDRRVLALTISVALATGTLAALAPAWLVTRMRGLAALGKGTMTSKRAPLLRGAIAVLQLALSVTLLVGALLLVATLRNLRSVDLGLDPTDVTVVNVDLSDHGYDAARSAAYHREVLSALRADASFEGVTLAGLAPFGSTSSISIVPVEGGAARRVASNGVADNYFQLLSIPIVRGRAFNETEANGGGDGMAVIVNETLAQQLYGTVDVVGRPLRFEKTAINPEREHVIVGVARDSRWRSIAGDQAPFLYQPFGHFLFRISRGAYLIKSKQSAPRVGEIANAIAARTAGSVPLTMPRPLTNGLDRELSEQRTFAWMLSLLAALGFGLAALGLYGLVAQATVERRREFGIRLALGAAAGDIVRLVARYAAVVSGIGATIGLSLAYAGTRLIERMLFGVSPLEPAVYASAVTTLAVVVLLACAGPTWRALRVRPVDVLRAE